MRPIARSRSIRKRPSCTRSSPTRTPAPATRRRPPMRAQSRRRHARARRSDRLGLVQITRAGTAGSPGRTDPAPAEAPHDRRVPAALRSLTPAREACSCSQTRQYDAARQKLEGALRTGPTTQSCSRFTRASRRPTAISRRRDSARSGSRQPIRTIRAAQFVLGIVLEMGNDDRGAQTCVRKSDPARSAIARRADPARQSPDAQRPLRRCGRELSHVDADRARQRRSVDASDGRRSRERQMRRGDPRDQWRARQGRAQRHPDAALRSSDQHVQCEQRRGKAHGARLRRQDLPQSDAAPIGEAYALALAANGSGTMR